MGSKNAVVTVEEEEEDATRIIEIARKWRV